MPARPKLPEIEGLEADRREGLSNREIADIYGVTPEAVRQAFARHGVINDNGTQRRRTSTLPRPRRPIAPAVGGDEGDNRAIAAALRKQARDLLELADRLDAAPSL